MIKDFFVSFKDNFQEKAKNPFLGTYLIVWLFRNWELIYTVFNFDSDQKLKDRVLFIKNYYIQNEFLQNLASNIYWAFGLLVLTYLLLNVSRLIVNLFEKRLTPWIYKITDSKSIVLKSAYLNLMNERDELQTRLDQERESKSRLETRIKNLEIQIIEFNTPKTAAPVTKQTKKTTAAIKTGDEDLNILIKKLKERDLLEEFLETSVKINKGEYIDNDYKAKDYFIQQGLIRFSTDHFNQREKKYTLTSDGENILRRARLE